MTSPPSYRVLSATAPALQLSSASVEVGKEVTISGTYFLGLPPNSTVTIAVTDAKGTTTLSSQAVVQDDGTFNLPWSVIGAAGGANVLAKSTPENGARSALQATAALTILAQASPATTPSAVGGSVGPGTNGNHNDNSAGVIIALIIGIVLLMLVMLGVVAFLLLRKRGPSPDAGVFGSEYVPGAYPGYADRSKVPVNVPQGATGRQTAVGRFGQSGYYEQAGVFPGPPVGGVAQWDELDAREDSDWQPRPMTGSARQHGLPAQDDAPTHPGSLSGPADPWASQVGGYGALPQFDPDDEWGDGATQAAEPGAQDRP